MAGIDELRKIAARGFYAAEALTILVTIAQEKEVTPDELGFVKDCPELRLNLKVPAAIVKNVQRGLRAFMLDQLGDADSRRSLLAHLSSLSLFSGKKADTLSFLMGLLVDSHLVLNRVILERFEQLVGSSPKKEEDLHRFLVDHPILLDPLAVELKSKHQLGTEFITDFVLRRINDEYVLVEIENSTDRLFKKDGSFTADLTKAVAQVRDFQGWVSDNISYAQSKLPEIRHPWGLVVIGLRRDLGPEMVRRLGEENFSRRGHIRIVTFDDLLDQATAVYRNMLDGALLKTAPGGKAQAK